jgi:hypothetical protein
MRRRLVNLLLETHCLLRDPNRDRGIRPGPQLERDVEWLANLSLLSSIRRAKEAPFGGYYSGLLPETDLFVYDGPEFLQIEIKDTCFSRFHVTELWARALDLHLGSACTTYSLPNRRHYVLLVVAGSVDDRLRSACVRLGIILIEPRRLPIAILQYLVPNLAPHLCGSGCTPHDLEIASLPFNRRFPVATNGILVPYGRFRSGGAVHAILRFQELATRAYYARLKADATPR